MTTEESAQGFLGVSLRTAAAHDKAILPQPASRQLPGLGRHELPSRLPAKRRRNSGPSTHCFLSLVCLFKVADGHLSPWAEPWHALGYLQACLRLLHELYCQRTNFARSVWSTVQSALALGSGLLTGGERAETVSPD